MPPPMLLPVFPYTTLFRSSVAGPPLPAEPPRLVRHARARPAVAPHARATAGDRKSTRLNSSHRCNQYAVFRLKKKESMRTDIHSIIRNSAHCLFDLLTGMN